MSDSAPDRRRAARAWCAIAHGRVTVSVHPSLTWAAAEAGTVAGLAGSARRVRPPRRAGAVTAGCSGSPAPLRAAKRGARGRVVKAAGHSVLRSDAFPGARAGADEQRSRTAGRRVADSRRSAPPRRKRNRLAPPATSVSTPTRRCRRRARPHSMRPYLPVPLELRVAPVTGTGLVLAIPSLIADATKIAWESWAKSPHASL